jgi:hypothetical protein
VGTDSFLWIVVGVGRVVVAGVMYAVVADDMVVFVVDCRRG